VLGKEAEACVEGRERASGKADGARIETEGMHSPGKSRPADGDGREGEEGSAADRHGQDVWPGCRLSISARAPPSGRGP
jgi:hypothetical protein